MEKSIPVLWWNRTVVTADGRAHTLPADGDSVLNFCAFATTLNAPALRIFYASATLEHFSTPCPKGTRATLQRALSPRYPALDNPLIAWAAHTVRVHASGASTLLYIEQQPQLARLRAALEERGIALEAVFPLLVLVEAAPPMNERDKPTLAVLHTDEAAAVYWTTPGADRHAAFFDGPTARERMLEELVTGFSAFEGKTTPVFTVVNLGTAPVDLTGVAQPPAKLLSAAEFLAHADRVSARDVHNLLPLQPRWSLDHLCHAAALGFFLGTLALAGNYLVTLRAAQADVALQHSQEHALAEENARLRANQIRIAQSAASLAEVAIARPVKRQFLEALNRARPPQISIRSVSLNETTWTITAYAHEGVNAEKGPYQSFLAAFEKSGGWTIARESRKPAINQPEFSLSGTIP